MEKLTVDLENCHGIKKLSAEFDFRQSAAVAIYAPNGAMKTSLAKTFRDISRGQKSADHIFTNRATKRLIKDEGGNDLNAEDVVVLKSYEDVPPTEKTSTLLVNRELRAAHEKLHKEVSESKERLVKSLRSISGSKNIEREISLTFTPSDNEFIMACCRFHRHPVWV